MKLLVSIILTGLLAYVCAFWLPWWSIALAAFVIALLIPQRPAKAFLAGLLGIFLLWALIATIIDIRNESLLSAKIAEVLPLGGSSILLILVTGMVGGLVGGFAAMSGSYLRRR